MIEDGAEDSIVNAQRQLWAAVLLQAIEDLAAGHQAPAGERRNLAILARQWVDSAEVGTGSFVFVCGVLDLDPGLMRTRIRNRAATMNVAQLRQLWQQAPREQLEVFEDEEPHATVET